MKFAYLVSGFIGHIESEGDWNLDDFACKPFDWDRINRNCENFVVFHSDNDAAIPMSIAEEYASKLNTSPIVIKKGGHLCSRDGFSEFPLLLKTIEEERFK